MKSTPTPLEGTNGIECIACKSIHSRIGMRFCNSCSKNLTLKEKTEAARKSKNRVTSHYADEAWIGGKLYDRAYIVLAVNAHEEMLEVLKRIDEFLTEGSSLDESALYDDSITFGKMVKHAITKAEGK